MLYKEYVTIKSISLHKVGNKLNQDQIIFSKSLLDVDNNVKELLINYFLSGFKSEEYYRFYHDVNLSLNEIYTYVSHIFSYPENLYEQSISIAKHLYNNSGHPRIKGGEFYVTYFKDCILNGQTIDAVGLFKSENKDTFLEVGQLKDDFSIESHEGININKLDKGCLIFNTAKENGFIISLVDNISKGNEAQYWKDDFLSVMIINNDFQQTNQFLGITKKFVINQLSSGFGATKADQIDLLNRSVDYFKTHDTFVKSEFVEEVFVENNIIESFSEFDKNYRQENEVEISDNFEISPQAVKRQAKVFKSVLKLDKNFHIYIHGNRKLIEQGVDDNGRKYYKIYYEVES